MQVNQSVNAANFLLVGSQATNPATAKDESGKSMDFASVFQNTTSSYSYQDSSKQSKDVVVSSIPDGATVKNSTDDSLSKDKVETKRTDSSGKPEEVAKVTDTKESKEPENTANDNKVEAEHSEEGIAVDSTEKVEEAGEVIDVMEGMEVLSEEDMATILETIGNLLQSVMEQFNLSVEELSSKLEEFGMEAMDLLTEDGLKEFFLKMKGAEVSDLIVNENLNTELQMFLGEMSEDLNTLKSVLPNVETIAMDETVKNVMTELNAVVEDEMDITFSDDTMGTMVDKAMDEAEPEVVVTDNRETSSTVVSKENNSTGRENGRADTSTQQSTTQDTPVMETTASKETTFENPILQAIQNAVNNVEGTVVSEQQVRQTDIVRQVVEQVRLTMNQQTTSLELQLYPEHLGRIQIHVVSKEGVMTASIVAETEAAKQAIEAGLLNLKEAMEQQDLKVEAIEVMVSTMGFEKGDEQGDSMNDNHTSNSRRKIDLSDMGEEISVEDEAELEMMKATGSSVSYTA